MKIFSRNKVKQKVFIHRRKIFVLFFSCFIIHTYFSKGNWKISSDSLKGYIESDNNLQQVIREELEEELKRISSQNKLSSFHPKQIGLKIIIVSTWRAGSSFLNDILSSMPGAFNNFEPLCYLGTKVFRHKFDSESIKAQKFLKGVLNCKYNDDSFFKYFNGTQLVEQKYQTLSKICNKEEYKSVCYSKSFMEAACSMFPINVVKTVRLGLSLTEPFLQDKTQNLHVILLARDPRAIMTSRMSNNVVFCALPDCNDPSILCSQMSEDYDVYVRLSKEYPNRIHFVKYEDLAMSPHKIVKSLMATMNLSITRTTEEFISNHTSKELENEFSTYKIPAEHVHSWQSLLDKNNFTYFQSACSSYLKKVDYKIFNASEIASRPFNYLAVLNKLNNKLYPNYGS